MEKHHSFASMRLPLGEIFFLQTAANETEFGIC